MVKYHGGEPTRADTMLDDVLTPDPDTASTAETVPPPAPAEPVADAAGSDEPVAEAAGSEKLDASGSEETVADASGSDEPRSEGAEPEASNKRWYVVKVQSGREDTIKEAIERRVKIEGLEEFFGQIVIPVEHVTELRNGKRVHKYRKLYPGYLMCEVEYNDRILYLFRETSGVGDFVGGTVNRPPPPMSQHEIDRMIHQKKEPAAAGATAAPPKPKFDRGDRVRVRDGIFSGMEGEVKDILEQKGQVRVELTIFGRPTGVELEYWQVEQV